MSVQSKAVGVAGGSDCGLETCYPREIFMLAVNLRYGRSCQRRGQTVNKLQIVLHPLGVTLRSWAPGRIVPKVGLRSFGTSWGLEHSMSYCGSFSLWGSNADGN